MDIVAERAHVISRRANIYRRHTVRTERQYCEPCWQCAERTCPEYEYEWTRHEKISEFIQKKQRGIKRHVFNKVAFYIKMYFFEQARLVEISVLFSHILYWKMAFYKYGMFYFWKQRNMRIVLVGVNMIRITILLPLFYTILGIFRPKLLLPRFLVLCSVFQFPVFFLLLYDINHLHGFS